MEATVDIHEFMQHLEDQGLMIAPRSLVERNIEDREIQAKKRRALAKKALTFKEVSEARLWGDISVKAVKSYALKHAKPSEVVTVPRGKSEQYKIMISAVKRIAIQRGNGTEL